MRFLTLFACLTICVCSVGFVKNFAAQQAPQNAVLADCWQDLAAQDAAKAYRAIWILARNSDAAVKYLQLQLSPAQPPDLPKIEAWLADLDDPKFAVRDKAFKELELQGELAEGVLKKALDGKLNLEPRQRVQQLLEKLKIAVTSPEKLRVLRAIEVLEIVGTADAKAILQRLATGFGPDRITRDAQETLLRMRERAVSGVKNSTSATGIGKADIATGLPTGAVMRLGTTLFRGESGGLDRIAFSADSKLIACAGATKVSLWEAQTGKLLHQENFAAACVAFAPKGRLLAIGLAGAKGQASEVVLWDAETKKELVRVALPGDANPEQLFFAAEGSQIVCKTKDRLRTGEMRIFDANSLQQIKHWKSEEKGELVYACSPDGKHVVIVVPPLMADGLIWNLETNTKLPFFRFSSTPNYVTFSPDSKYFAATGSFATGLRVWDTATAKPVWTLVNERPHAYRPLLFSPNGKIFAATTDPNNGGISLWNLQSGQFLKDLPDSAGFSAAAISPDSRWLVGRTVYAIRVWDLESGQQVADGEGDAQLVDHISFLPQANAIVTANGRGIFRFWDANTGKQTRVFDSPASRNIAGVAISADSTKLATYKDDGLDVWDVAMSRKVYKLPGHGQLGSLKRPLQITPDGRFLLSWSPTDMYLRTWDLKNGKGVLEHLIQPTGANVTKDDQKGNPAAAMLSSISRPQDGAFTSRGDELVVACDATVHFFETATGQETRFLKLAGKEQSYNSYIYLSPTKKHFAIAFRGSLTLYDWKTGNVVTSRSVTEALSYAAKATFTPDGRTLAILADGKVSFVEITLGKTRLTVELPTKARLVEFEPDGRRFVTAQEDTTALVWDCAALSDRK